MNGDEYGEGEGHSGGEDKANGVPMDVRNGAGQGSSPGLQVPLSQQTQATVCWERFLHVRTIRVLLVENDDCTRYIVTALLRNCSYEGRSVLKTMTLLVAYH